MRRPYKLRFPYELKPSLMSTKMELILKRVFDWFGAFSASDSDPARRAPVNMQILSLWDGLGAEVRAFLRFSEDGRTWQCPAS